MTHTEALGTAAEFPLDAPDIMLSVGQTFGIDSNMEVPAFSIGEDHVPDVDEAYQFDRDTTLAILAGFAHNRRVMIQGYHGTGKSTHIEQVAARLNWPCIRVNLDSHISRIDMVGRDAIVLRDGKQVTEFREGMLPWALQHPTALVFDEYDAGRPDVMFVIQRVLEVEGKLTFEGDYVLNGGRCVWTYRKVWTGLPRPAPIRHPHHPGCECRHRWQWAGGGFIVAGQSLDVVVDGFQRLDQRGEPRTMGVGKDRGSSGLPPNRTGDV